MLGVIALFLGITVGWVAWVSLLAYLTHLAFGPLIESVMSKI